MTLTYQLFTAVLLLIYGSLFLSGIYYCQSVFWCAAARMSELELEQRTNITHILVFKIPKTSADQKYQIRNYFADSFCLSQSVLALFWVVKPCSLVED